MIPPRRNKRHQSYDIIAYKKACRMIDQGYSLRDIADHLNLDDNCMTSIKIIYQEFKNQNHVHTENAAGGD